MNDTQNNQSTTPEGKKTCRRLPVFQNVLAALTVILALLGTATTFFSFDGESRYFENSAPSIALAIASGAAVALAISAFFVFKGVKLEKTPAKHRKSALALRALTVIHAAFCAFYAISGISAAQDDKNGDASRTFAVLLIFLMFTLCAVYNVSHSIKLNKTLVIFSGFAQIAFCLYVIATLYFDRAVELNSPFKLIVQFTAAAIAIDTCMELRDVISGVSTRAYIAAKTLSVSLGLLCAAIILCAVAKGAAIDGIGYVCYSSYFLLISICSDRELARVKYPTSEMLTTDTTAEPSDELDVDESVDANEQLDQYEYVDTDELIYPDTVGEDTDIPNQTDETPQNDDNN